MDNWEETYNSLTDKDEFWCGPTMEFSVPDVSGIAHRLKFRLDDQDKVILTPAMEEALLRHFNLVRSDIDFDRFKCRPWTDV